MVTPAFAVTHLKKLTPVFLYVAKTLRDAIAAEVKERATDMNVASWIGRGTLEVVGQVLMSYSFDPLADSTPDEYTVATKSLMPSVSGLGIQWFLTRWTVYLGPPKFRRWLLDLYPYSRAQQLKRIVDTLWSKAMAVVEQRKNALENGEAENQDGKDIISILLRANMEASEEDRLPYDQLVAQVNTLVFASSDTTSNVLSRLLHTLSEHPDAQDTLRQEIIDFRNSGEELTYESLSGLRYLDAIYRETLRVYPPVLILYRLAQLDTVLPLSKPIKDIHGIAITEVPVTKGTFVFLGLYSYNRSKDVWGEDASEWKPERWLQPLPKQTSCGGAFSNLMTFGGGPRSCVGLKHAELELKAFLFFLIESFKFTRGNADVVWNTAFVVSPSSSKESTKTEMSLHVELIR